MNKREALDILEKISDEGYYQIIWEGYDWYKKNLEPALETIGNYPEEHTSLLAESWFALGWSFYELDAPLKAIACYHKAVEFDTTHSESYRELANCLHKVGQYEQALNYVIKARDLDPDDDFAIEQQEEIESSMEQDEEPYYMEDDLGWACSELMAEDKLNEVNQLIKGRRKTEFLVIRARCYSAQKENKKYLNTLRSIINRGTFFDWTYQEWFYLNAHLYNKLSFWKTMLEMVPLLGSESVFETYQSLSDNHHGNSSTRIKREAVCLFHIYRLEQNVEGILKLHQSYPDWKELKDVANELMPPGISGTSMPG